MPLAAITARPVLANSVAAWFGERGFQAGLNVGCGNDYREGWVNVDQEGPADVRHDLFNLPWPFPDASFTHVLMDQFLEHVPPRLDGRSGDGAMLMLRECSRLLAPGGRLLVGVPDGSHQTYRDNPFHYRAFTRRSFGWAKRGDRSEAAREADLGGLELRGVLLARRLQWAGLDSSYHGPKYLGYAPNVGPVESLYFQFEKRGVDHT